MNEPIAEIALDDGVGIGTMVRNAFALADNMHMRAAVAASSTTAPADVSPMHHNPNGDNVPDNADNIHVREEEEDNDDYGTRPLQSNHSRSDYQETLQRRGHNLDGGPSAEEGSTSNSENEHPVGSSGDSSSG